MISSKFFIKSNYIKNTKNDWIYCEGKLLYHQNITFLHLKSANVDRLSAEAISETTSNFSGFSLSQLPISKTRNLRLNVLCNLRQFKSCEIKSVNFKTVFKFAIKLVPSGFLRSKKLYLLPDIEDNLTEWCGILTGFISNTNTYPILDSAADDKSAMTISSTLRATNMIEKSKRTSVTHEVYISLDDNDAYEASSQDEFYLVSVELTPDSLKLGIKGNYIMKLGTDALELLDIFTRESIHLFPYSSIRRFGAKDDLLRLEAGRRCTTGNGSFIFSVKDAIHIAEKLKTNAKKIKLAQTPMHNSCMTLNKPSTSEVSLQIQPKSYATLNSKNRQSMEILPKNELKLSDKISRTQTLIGTESYSTNGKKIVFRERNSELPRQLSVRESFDLPQRSDYTYSQVDKESKIQPNKEFKTTELTANAESILKSNSNEIENEEDDSYLSVTKNCLPEILCEIPPIITVDMNDETDFENGFNLPESIPIQDESDQFKNPDHFQYKIDELDPQTCQNKDQGIMSNDKANPTIYNTDDASLQYFHPINTNGESRFSSNFKSDDSINDSLNAKNDQRPTSLFEHPNSQISSRSTSCSNNSPTFSSLPFPNQPMTADYKVSESTFFKYRQLPKLPARTTPPLNSENRSTSFSASQSISSNIGRSDSVISSSVKKSPPPILPKPKFKSSQEKLDQSSFREFDQMLKNLNLSFC